MLHSERYLLPSPKADIAILLPPLWYENEWRTPYVDKLDSSIGRPDHIRSASKYFLPLAPSRFRVDMMLDAGCNTPHSQVLHFGLEESQQEDIKMHLL